MCGGPIDRFVSTLVFRTDLSGNPRFLDLLDRVRENALDVGAHNEVPYARLIEELQAERDFSRNPLSQVMFVLQSAPGGAPTVPGLTLVDQGRDAGAPKFDLTLALSETPDGLLGQFEYANDLFDAPAIEGLARHFTTLLEGIVVDPGQPIGHLPLLTSGERHQLLVKWNDTAVDYPRDRCIHQLFEEQVESTPEAVALVFDDEQLTYAELNARANQLAHYLISLGVGPDVLVGICLERSPELIVGLLAILKAGGAYVPLDPSYPKQRLAFMLQDTRAPVLLTQESLLGSLPRHESRTLCVDRDRANFTSRSQANPSPVANKDDLAYVIYTSGSSGTPKGVMVPHAGIVRLVRNTDYIRLDATDCVAQASNPSFDAATFEIWGALANGSRLIMIKREDALDLPRLADEWQRGGVTTLFLTTALFNEVVRIRPGAFAGMKQVLFGGEAVDSRRVAECMRAARPQRLLHVYGPTETTTFATWYAVEEDSIDRRPIPIGRPIANTVVHVLDKYQQPVPVGVAGEIYIGGDGLARGYWSSPERTAERFVPNPFSAVPGSRLYRTGDVARYLPDGNIEFLGRLDDQVKLRGFRIELGEIEAALARQPQVLQAVVQLREDTPGDKRLVAYVVTQGEMPATDRHPHGTQGTASRVHDPGRVRAVAGLAAHPERQARPQGAAGAGSRCRVRTFDPAAQSGGGSCGRNLVRAAAPAPGRRARRFFDLGGHSLLAIQMLSRLRDVFGVELSVRHVFDGATIAELASLISAQLAGDARGQALPIVPVPRATHLPLSFAQQRLWLLHRLLPDQGIYNIPVAWRLRGPLDEAALARSLDALVARHETLRTRFTMVKGEAVQVIDPPHPAGLLLTDLSAMPIAEGEAHARHIVDIDAGEPFDLEAGPVFRARLLRLADDDHVLLLNMHHIASDAWSMGVLGRELSAAYDALINGREWVLPALPIQYADYAQWHRQWLQREVLERQLAYWRRQLEGLTPLELPTDRPREPTQSYRGGRDTLALSGDVE